jgi:NTP pyrophosphatase (non-canonical NTP hydrolase)
MMSDTIITLADLREQVAQFVAQRAWETYHTPKSLSMAIAIEAAELMELFQWHDNQASRQAAGQEEVRQAVAGELADVMIYCLALANALDMEVGEAVTAKLALNQRRYPPGQLPSRHRRLQELGDSHEDPSP